LQREQLFARIDALRRHPVVWIAGPPGAGKTTLLASYLEGRSDAVIWYQLDAGDADLSTFFLYLNQAAGHFTGTKQELPLLTPEYLADLPGFARRYFRELFSRLPQDSVLVLDNFQEVPLDSAYHRAVEAAMSEVPAHCNLVVISREQPSSDYMRGIARGDIAQLRPAELQLSLEECRELAGRRCPLPACTVEALHARADGWAAGVVLMLERAEADGLESERIGLASREAVFDYFASIFFDRVPESAQRALMLCALVPELTASSAAEISQDPVAPALLDNLFRHQLFVQRLGAAEPVYRFHSLLREFLEARARRVFSAADLQAARLRAARCAEAASDIEQAYELFAGSARWNEASRLLVTHAPRLCRGPVEDDAGLDRTAAIADRAG
jgi:ATP/maltotriose-dependent transcriptional regulator MalT